MPCPLCAHESLRPVPLDREPKRYFDCVACGFRFLDPADHLSPEAEVLRYRLHQNDAGDRGYRDFVLPLVERLVAKHEVTACGLDYGSGPSPDSAVHRMLSEKGFADVARYDHYFHPNTAELVSGSFDFVFACEVVEHFRKPAEEFQRIAHLLKPGGTLALMTSILNAETDFENWHYRRDPTHVGFYSRGALEALAVKFGFEDLEIQEPRTITMSRVDILRVQSDKRL